MNEVSAASRGFREIVSWDSAELIQERLEDGSYGPVEDIIAI